MFRWVVLITAVVVSVGLWVGIWFVTPAGVKEIVSAIQSKQNKKIVIAIETVRVYAKDGKHFREVKAKIDTGAYSSSIDEKLAYGLGFENALSYYRSLGLDTRKVLSEKEVRGLKETDIESKLKKHPDIDDAVVIRSASGATYRIKIPLTFYLKGVEIKTSASVADRSNLSCPVLIGRRDLGAFLVKPYSPKPE